MAEEMKKEINMEEIKEYTDKIHELGLDDLDSVTGGYTRDQLNEEERFRCRMLDESWIEAQRRYKLGLCSFEEYDAAWKELVAYVEYLQKKYG